MNQQDLDRLERMHTEVMDYLVVNKRTYQEEYELVQQKKSKLTKRGRDYVTLLVAYDVSKSKEVETTIHKDGELNTTQQ